MEDCKCRSNFTLKWRLLNGGDMKYMRLHNTMSMISGGALYIKHMCMIEWRLYHNATPTHEIIKPKKGISHHVLSKWGSKR
jgi:hypothetical protein